MSGAHQNVVGDLAEGQSQVDDVILRAAAFGEVADVHNSAGRDLSGWKRLQEFNLNVFFLNGADSSWISGLTWVSCCICGFTVYLRDSQEFSWSLRSVAHLCDDLTNVSPLETARCSY